MKRRDRGSKFTSCEVGEREQRTCRHFGGEIKEEEEEEEEEEDEQKILDFIMIRLYACRIRVCSWEEVMLERIYR